MKKYLTTALAALSLAFTFAAVACGDENEKKNENEGSSYSFTYTGEEGAKIVCATPSGTKVADGAVVTFTVDIGAFISPDVTVKANGETITADENGVYTLTVTKDTVVTISDVEEDVSSMVGTGTSTDAFQITRPVDLLYIAEQVNNGNQTYATGCYVLQNDIDLEGAELEIIGNGKTLPNGEQAVFSGVFNGMGNDNVAHTISNFTIKSTDSNYVGLFGLVMANMSSSNTASIYNLNIDNFKIEANAEDIDNFVNINGMNVNYEVVMCGGIAGYGYGANIYLCNATNGEINVDASTEPSMFAYAGGIAGFITSTYEAVYDARYLSSVVYCTSDVEINAFTGNTLAAGGVVGQLEANDPTAPAHVTNCYAAGNISGAIRAGGVVGFLSRHTAVLSSYSTAESVYANSSLTDVNLFEEYCYSHAGGVVGYAANETIVADCFATGTASASSALSGYSAQKDILGGFAKAGAEYVNEKAAVVENCYHKTDAITESFLKDSLKWPEYDWKIENGAPVFNQESTDVIITVTVNLGGETYNNLESFEVSVENGHVPFAYLYLAEQNGEVSLPEYMTSGSGLRSYGYFFDAALTKPVPYGYVPTRNVTVYAGFADYADVAGEYLLGDTADNIGLTLNKDGTYEYVDGGTVSEGVYAYNDETGEIVFFSARFARYYDAGTFDYTQYELYNFLAYVQESTAALEIYDGSYFTKTAPLTATKGSMIETGAKFDGAWRKSAAIPRVYEFTSTTREWKHTLEGNTVAQGVYEIQTDGSLLLDNGALAFFNENGFLQIVNGALSEIYYGEKSYQGVWYDATYRSTLTLDGIGANGLGTGRIDYAPDENGQSVYYILSYDTANTNGYAILYSDGQIFGYISYNAASDALTATMYIYSVGDTVENLPLTYKDSYTGAWISENETFHSLVFDGFGNQRKVTITDKSGNQTTVSYTASATSSLRGSFTLNGTTYTFDHLDETGQLMLTAGSSSVTVERKDAYADLTLTNKTNSVSYVFDGRGQLAGGGTLTVGNQLYKYKVAADGSVNVYANDADGVNGAILATITAGTLCYQYQKGTDVTDLYIATQYTGEWALRGSFGTMYIGPRDFKGNVEGSYLGKVVQFKQVNQTYMTFEYVVQGESTLFYVYILNSGGLAVSLYENIYVGEYTLCERKDDLFGKWTSQSGTNTWEFDGVGTSPYDFGVARSAYKGAATEYNYHIFEDKMIIWNYSYTHLVEFCAPNEEGAFINGDKAIKITEIDAFYLYVTTATDADGVEYSFDGQYKENKRTGTVTATKNGDVVKTYSYKILAFGTDTVSLLFIDGDGTEYTVTFDYSEVTDLTKLDAAKIIFKTDKN